MSHVPQRSDYSPGRSKLLDALLGRVSHCDTRRILRPGCDGFRTFPGSRTESHVPRARAVSRLARPGSADRQLAFPTPARAYTARMT